MKIIALDRPFLMALPNLSKQLFFVHDDPASRMKLVRQVSGHLRGGGAALTFPAGEIEPDPNVYPGAVDALQTWTDSVGVFIRMAPETVDSACAGAKRDLGQNRQPSIAQNKKDKDRKREISRRSAIAGNGDVECQACDRHRADRQAD